MLPIKCVSGSEYAEVGYSNDSMTTNGELTVVQKLISDDDIVFDVGANKGDWTGEVKKYHSNTRILAFEPIPEMAARFRKQLPFVPVFELAISDSKDTCPFDYYPGVPELSGLHSRPILQFHKVSINVQTVSLDEFCKEHHIDHINFLKIDTEGNELKVIKGIGDIKIDYIQFEYGGTYSDAKTTLEEVFKVLHSKGYKIYRITCNYLIYLESWDPSLETFRYSNYIACLNQ